MVSLEELRNTIRGSIRLEESLAPFAKLGVGGPAEYLVEPADEGDFVSAVGYFQEREIPFILIRPGSNILVAAGGYRGAAISIDRSLGEIHMDASADLVAGAGVSLSAFVEFCFERGLGGAEVFAGLEGTVGGALIRQSAADVRWEGLIGVTVLRGGNVVRTRGAERLQRGRVTGSMRDIILGAKFRFSPGDKETLLRRRREQLIAHNAARPVNIGGGTVMFRDPSGIAAAELIVRAGLGALRRGAVAVSGSNANVLLRSVHASPEEILSALRFIQKTVRRRSGVVLEPCIALIGFDGEAMREVA